MVEILAVDSTGFIVLMTIGVVLILGGLAVLTDWRGIGSRQFRATSGSMLPGAKWYRGQGKLRFQVIVGGSALTIGLLVAVLDVVSLIRD